MIIKFEFEITPKRLHKLGFIKKTEVRCGHEDRTFFVMGKHMNDCGHYNDTIVYNVETKVIKQNHGGNVYVKDDARVESMTDIKKFLNGRDISDDSKYGLPDPHLYRLALKNVRENRIKIIRKLSTLLNISLIDAKQFCDESPCYIERDIDGEKAKHIKKEIEELGAEIEIITEI